MRKGRKRARRPRQMNTPEGPPIRVRIPWPLPGRVELGHFKDEEDVYRFIGRLFRELADDPELAPKLRKADTTVRYEMSDPEARITVDMPPGRDLQVDLGPSELDPEVVMVL